MEDERQPTRKVIVRSRGGCCGCLIPILALVGLLYLLGVLH